jgi:hypothetical protein
MWSFLIVFPQPFLGLLSDFIQALKHKHGKHHAFCRQAIDEAEAEDSTFDASMAKLWSFPEGAAFQQALAIDCYRCGRYLNAIVYALRSVCIAPDNVISIYVLGRSYLAQE